MVKTVKWAPRAVNNFKDIVTYLQQEWGEQVSVNFVFRTYQIIDVLVTNPGIGTLQNAEKKIRGFVLTKHMLFYRYDYNRIIILSILITGKILKKSNYNIIL